MVSLKTTDREAARKAAFDLDMDVQYRIKLDVPIFNRPFSDVAKEYAETQRERADTGHISKVRANNIASAIRTLNLYVGSKQIHLVGQADWDRYPIWRRKQKRRVKEDDPDKPKLKRKASPTKPDDGTQKPEEKDWRVSDWTIRAEMSVFRSVMVYAAKKKYIAKNNVFEGKLHSADERREEFTREEYRALHSKGRAWLRRATTTASRWYREITYNFVLIMCNTGMRPPEAKNLRWRDVTITTIRKETKGKANKNEERPRARNCSIKTKRKRMEGRKGNETTRSRRQTEEQRRSSS